MHRTRTGIPLDPLTQTPRTNTHTLAGVCIRVRVRPQAWTFGALQVGGMPGVGVIVARLVRFPGKRMRGYLRAAEGSSLCTLADGVVG